MEPLGTEEKAFILSHNVHDRGDHCHIEIYGTGERGPFKVSITHHEPLFFIERSTELPEKISGERKELGLCSFSGQPLDGLYHKKLSDYFSNRRHLKEVKIPLYESDVWASSRYLMERFIKGGVLIQGEPRREGRLNHYVNPHLLPAEYRPSLKVLSLDIETGQKGELYSIALYQQEAELLRQEILMLGQGPEAENLSYYPQEKELLLQLNQRLEDWDPDLITGWHVIGFDLSFLQEKADQLGIPFLPGREKQHLQIKNNNGMYSAETPGRIILDAPQTLRTGFYSFENWKLETVARELLGEGKDIEQSGKEKIEEIERRFREDKPALAFYNLEDCRLVWEILQKTELIPQLVTRSLITGMALDRVNQTIQSFDYFLLPLMHRKGLAAPDAADVEEGPAAPGGLVFSSKPGKRSWVAVMDFKSLYPSLIRTFKIDPLSWLHRDLFTLKTPTGYQFSRENHILPDFLEEMMKKRQQAKEQGDTYLSQAIKILMNSFYGAMGTPHCRFYNPSLPAAITETGQWVLNTLKEYLQNRGYPVIYGDTDSVFVELQKPEAREVSPQELKRQADLLVQECNAYFRGLLEGQYELESHLELEMEKIYKIFYLPPMRGSQEGARKRYVGELLDGKLEFKGMETVRTDWTPLARRFQKELFQRYFAEEDLSLWLKEFTAELKAGKYDVELVFHRKLSKPSSQYVKNIPPHVKALKRLDPEDKKDLRTVDYLMTPDGPWPVELNPERIDYHFYMEKQIAPLADMILQEKNQNYLDLVEIGQMDLF